MMARLTAHSVSGAINSLGKLPGGSGDGLDLSVAPYYRLPLIDGRTSVLPKLTTHPNNITDINNHGEVVE